MRIRAVLLLMATIVGAVLFLRDEPVQQAVQAGSEPAPPSLQPSRQKQQPKKPQPTRTAQPAVASPLPPSFAGTQVDGHLRADRAGNLIIDADVRQAFDYFLASIGEEPLAASVARLQRHIQTQLPEPAEHQATTLLSQYLDYKRQLMTLEQDHARQPDLDAMRARLSAVQQLRAGIFDDAAHRAFFAIEEAADGFTLERLALRHDQTLTAAEQGAALDRLRDSLPPELQRTLAVQLQSELRERTNVLQASGGSSAELRQLRQQLVGNAAAERLEQLDAKRSDWQSRVMAYQQDKNRIENARGLGNTDQQAAIRRLASQRFDANEQLRLETAERLLSEKNG